MIYKANIYIEGIDSATRQGATAFTNVPDARATLDAVQILCGKDRSKVDLNQYPDKMRKA